MEEKTDIHKSIHCLRLMHYSSFGLAVSMTLFELLFLIDGADMISSLLLTHLSHRSGLNTTNMMNTYRGFARLAARQTLSRPVTRALSSTTTFRAEDQDGRIHSNAKGYREDQKSKADNPHMTNTNSTFNNDMPKIGKDKPPPEFISSADPDYIPTDAHPENTERMTGGTQPGKGNSSNVSPSELGVGEMEGASFRIEPLRRTGEDATTMRARLLCPS